MAFSALFLRAMVRVMRARHIRYHRRRTKRPVDIDAEDCGAAIPDDAAHFAMPEMRAAMMSDARLISSMPTSHELPDLLFTECYC